MVVQARTAQTAGRSCACGCPSFSLRADKSLPPAEVPERMVSDAHGVDPAGNAIGVLLFTEDGYLSEVEVYSVEGDGLDELPRADALTLSEWSEPDERGTSHLLNPKG